ncbi:MAG: manganese efflux pump [Clostridia bacterium]|nr:manganese efflux pump [Clostridia bacterium]
MGMGELVILSIGLAMDAFAVSICKGLAVGKVKMKHMLLAGFWFGGFQAGMPFLGYLLGSSFASYITPFDHWLAFVLLGFLGVKMFKDALSNEEHTADCSFGAKTMLLMAVATSIDALVVGIPFASPAMANVNIGFVVGTIGIITFLFSAIGVEIGSVFGARYKQKSQLLGGAILIVMGAKILLEHLDLLPF